MFTNPYAPGTSAYSIQTGINIELGRWAHNHAGRMSSARAQAEARAAQAEINDAQHDEFVARTFDATKYGIPQCLYQHLFHRAGTTLGRFVSPRTAHDWKARGSVYAEMIAQGWGVSDAWDYVDLAHKAFLKAGKMGCESSESRIASLHGLSPDLRIPAYKQALRRFPDADVNGWTFFLWCSQLTDLCEAGSTAHCRAGAKILREALGRGGLTDARWYELRDFAVRLEEAAQGNATGGAPSSRKLDRIIAWFRAM